MQTRADASDTTISSYNAAGQLQSQSVLGNGYGPNQSDSAYIYDSAGRLQRHYLNANGQANQYDYTYRHDDSSKVETIKVGLRDYVNERAATYNAYDANGHLVKATGLGENNVFERELFNDAAGRVLRRTQGGSITHTLIANGEVIGSSANDATSGTFGSNYVPVSDASLSSGPTAYVVQAGDTLRSIAKAMWGNANLWYLIADANGISEVTAGSVITIPSQSNTVYNDSQTFTPYNPSDAVGDTTPALPMPANGGGCGAIGQIIMIIVAIVVTLYTAGAASGFVGTFAQTLSAGAGVMTGGAAVGGSAAAGFFGAGATTLGVTGTAVMAGAVGSIASQVVGVAIGAQESFSWKQVALSGISAGVGAGLSVGWGGATGSFESVVVRAAAGNAISQGIGVATGLQDQFDWRSVAASAVGAGVGQAAGGAIGNSFGEGPVGNFANRAVSGLAAGGTAAVLRGGKVSIQQIATDAFGNALGSSIAESSSGSTNPASAYGYVKEMDRASDNYNPASEYGYRNGMDLQSDQAYEARRTQEWIGQSDAIQLGRLNALSGYGAGLPAAPDETSAAPMGDKMSAATSTGLGGEIDKLGRKSPSFQADLRGLKDAGWSITYGAPGSGSFASRPTQIVTLDGNLASAPAEAMRVLSHEVGHAMYPYRADYSSKSAYVNGALADEGAATMNNIKVQREIIAKGGPDIGIAGNPANHEVYYKAYDQYLKDGNAAAARSTIGAQFGRGEITSTTKQPYAIYYGDWYDKHYGRK